MEWIAALVGLIGGVILVALAVAGAMQAARGVPLRRVGSGKGPDPAPVGDPTFLEQVELHASARLRNGNRCDLLCNGDGTFPPLWEDLGGAGSSIQIQIYFAESSRIAERLTDVLEERARAGVRVELLFDAIGCRGLGGSYIDRLRRAGVQAHELRPPRSLDLARVSRRVHSRIVVVDGRVGYTGGFGISDRWEGDGRSPGSWRDTSVRFTGPAVRQLRAAFSTLWTEATGDLLVPSDPAADADGPHTAGFVHVSPGAGSSTAERLLALSAAGARERCFISSGYFAPDDGQVALLTGAAARGVDVRVLTAARRHTDAPLAYWAGRSRYAELLEAGVRIFEYQPAMMHAKTFVIDGVWLSLGALNWDNRSVALNDEATLLVMDRHLGARMEGMFLDDLGRAQEISREWLRRRGRLERVRAWAAARILRLV